MNPFTTLSRVVDHLAFRISARMLLVVTAAIDAGHSVISSMAFRRRVYDQTPDPSALFPDFVFIFCIIFIILLSLSIYRICKWMYINNLFLISILSIGIIYSLNTYRLEYGPVYDYDYSFISEYWPIIREVAFQNTVFRILFGSVLIVLTVRLIDTIYTTAQHFASRMHPPH